MTKRKPIEDMTLEEQQEWLDQYLADAPKRQAAHDSFALWAVVSMGAALLLVPVMFVIADIISRIT